MGLQDCCRFTLAEAWKTVRCSGCPTLALSEVEGSGRFCVGIFDTPEPEASNDYP
jgi:hypothetical protein